MNVAPHLKVVRAKFFNIGGSVLLVWEWPSGKMKWFMWRRSKVFPDTRIYRLGPVTLFIRDASY